MRGFTVLFAALLGGCSPVHCVTEQPVIAEVRIGDPFSVTLNGQGPFRFGLDTGQSVSLLISPDLAARLTLPVVDHIQASDGTDQKSVDVVRVESARLGEVALRDQLGLLIKPAASADGALGMPFFDGLLVERDGPAGRLRILRGSLPRPDGRTVLPLRIERGLPMITLNISGRESPALIDFGSAAGLILPIRMSADLPLAAPPVKSGRIATLFGEFDLWSAQLRGAVRIGELEVDDPILTFSEYFNEVNMGQAFLKDFKVTLDLKNGRARFEPHP